MVGLIVPGGWEEFFRVIGDPYSGPMWPLEDDRNFFEVLVPRLKMAAEKFDMVPCPQQKSFDPQPWLDDEGQLPGNLEPYFLRHGSGPACVLAGLVCRSLITTRESGGKFAIGAIEGSSQHHESSIFAYSATQLSFQEVHHAFLLTSGKVEFHIDGRSTKLASGELVYVPKGSAFSFRITSWFAKMYAFCSGGGLVELLQALGSEYRSPVVPEKATSWDSKDLRNCEGFFGGLKLC